MEMRRVGWIGDSVGRGTESGRGLWVCSLLGFLMTDVDKGPTGSLFSSWEISYDDKKGIGD